MDVAAPDRRFGRRLYTVMLVAVGWEFLSLVVGGPLLTGSGAGTGVFVALLLLGLVPAGVAARLWLVYRSLEDARVSVDVQDLSVGQGFSARVEQRARRGLRIKDMKLGLVCMETVRHRTPDGRQEVRSVPLLEKWQTLTRDKEVDAARELTATREFVIPAGQPASSPPEKTDPSVIRWKLRLVTTAAHTPPYDVDFLLHVKPTPATPTWEDVDAKAAPRA